MATPTALSVVQLLTGTFNPTSSNVLEKTMGIQHSNPITPDYTAIKTKQNAAWSSGDYSRIGAMLQLTGEQLAERANLAPGSTVLDVAAGNGNATLAFARRLCTVTSTDYVPTLLGRGKARAQAEGQDITFQVADAEDLPFADASFDAAASSFGVMFTPNQEQAARELVRVVRPGGTIALANWTPDGFIGQLFKTLGKHVPPPAGVKSPALWGDAQWLDDRFGAHAETIDIVQRDFVFRHFTPASFVEFFRTFYGPMHKAFLAVGETGANALQDDILALIAQFNLAEDDTMHVPSAYAEVIITKG